MSGSGTRRFTALVGPHFAALYRTAYRLTRRREEAEDLVQEACLRAFANLAALERAEHPAAWLQRVQYRIFIDGVRHRRRAPFANRADSEAELERAVSDMPSPEEMADAEQLQRCIAHAWRYLSKEQQALLALHGEGYSLADLERITGASRNALGVRLHRARSRLAGLLRTELDPRSELAPVES